MEVKSTSGELIDFSRERAGEEYLRMNDDEINQCNDNQLIMVSSALFVEGMNFGIHDPFVPTPGASQDVWRNQMLDHIHRFKAVLQKQEAAGKEVIRRSWEYIQSHPIIADFRPGFALREGLVRNILAEHYDIPRATNAPILWTDILRVIGGGDKN